MVCRELGHRYLFSALQTYQFTLGAANLSADGGAHAAHVERPALTGVSCVGNEASNCLNGETIREILQHIPSASRHK